MTDPVVLERESTSSRTVTSAPLSSRYLMEYTDGLRLHSFRTPLSVAMKASAGLDAFTHTRIARLLCEEVHAGLSGTIASGNAFRYRPFNSVVHGIFRTGFGDATQYLLRVETEHDTKPSRTSEKSLDTRDLTRLALELSGLTRDQLATAIGVKRQSVQNWLGAHGGMLPDNRERLRDLVSLFKRARRKLGNPKKVSTWLNTPLREDTLSPLELLAVSGIDAVKGQLLRGAPIRGNAVAPTQAARRIPRRTGPVGQRPPWTQPSRIQEFDPEEVGDLASADGIEEPYRDIRSPLVTGLARA